jgi:hypothetical protein
LDRLEQNAWGDHITLHAAASVFEVNIMVVSSLGEDATQFVQSTSGAGSDMSVVYIGHLAEHHYISLDSIQDDSFTVSVGLPHDEHNDSNDTMGYFPEFNDESGI